MACAARKPHWLLTWALFLLTAFLWQTGCSGGSGHGGNPPPPPPPPPPGGFSVGVATVNGNTGVQTGWESVSSLVGNWNADLSGAVGSVKSFGPLSGLTPIGISGGRRPAIWSGSYTDTTCPFFTGPFFWSNDPISGSGTNILGTCDNPPGGAAVPAFVTSNSLPATFTVQGSGLTTAHGLPRLEFYNEFIVPIATLTATSVSSDGTTATFPFPKNPDGTTLSARHYTFVVSNQTAPGVFADAFSGVYSIGTSDTSHTSPYGVDLADISTTTIAGNTSSTVTSSSPIITLVNQSQVVAFWDSLPINVGLQPVAVKAYAQASFGHVGCNRNGFCSGQVFSRPTKAIVANFGSNTVSMVQILTTAGGFSGAVTTLAVGTKPCTIVLSAGKAYVANYGSSSVSIVDLTSDTVTGTIAVGTQPAALAVDPSGNSLWVGGLNFISQYNLSTGAALNSVPSVSGQVTSIAISKALNAVVYTTVSTDLTRFDAVQADLAAGTFSAAASTTSPAPANAALVINKSTTLASADIRGTTFSNSGGLPGFLASSGALVSVPYGNRYSVMATPTGFVVQDLQSKTTILSGSTNGPVMGIATDPDTGMIYATIPNSNTLLSVPFPPT